ncbi:MAG: alpha-D-glucose phosphate-specific phosphoglucomutase [Gammaproteobacteria bacterium]|nr:alpha-D-glucose phosphate-specific phosphoglucomutase [Gammaproteobacteria bacterium]
MEIKTITTQPFDDQRPGTSGLRKKVAQMRQPNYLENYVQSIFEILPELVGGILIVGGDGRFYNDIAIQTIVRMAAANGVKRLMVGQNGILSTPAASAVIRKYGAEGGLVLSASHNPAGPDGDFGIKFNGHHGGPASETITEAIYRFSQSISSYKIVESHDIDLSTTGSQQLGEMEIIIFDPITDYADLMESIFDFDAIKAWITKGHSLRFDAMHAVTGPYATEILQKRLGAPADAIINGIPLSDFGGGHPDPNLVHAKVLVDELYSDGGPDFGAASDGDGDRNMILGNHFFVTPSDSLAIIAANAQLIPRYKSGISGIARSMPTSSAADRVAEKLGIEMHETPTGWKFFGNLLDAGRVTFCGEESFGTSSDHVREKDGIWAVLCWLNIIAARNESVAQIVESHWQEYGRTYYTRHDYEEIDLESAKGVMAHIESQFETLKDQPSLGSKIKTADNFSYSDPVDGSQSHNQGLRIILENGSRVVFRLSGTGTVGATLRIYIEKYESRLDKLGEETQIALSELINFAEQISEIKQRTGRDAPSVIT